MTLLIVYLHVFFALTIHTTAMALIAIRCDVGIREIAYGFGPTVARFNVRSHPIAIRLLQFGGYVLVKGDNDELPDIVGRSIDDLPGYRSAAIFTAGITVLIVISFSILGLSVFSIMYNGYVIFILGALDPNGLGQEVIAGILSMCDEHTMETMFARTCAVIAAINLLPPGSNGIDALIRIARIRNRAIYTGGAYVSLLFTLFAIIAWLVALI